MATVDLEPFKITLRFFPIATFEIEKTGSVNDENSNVPECTLKARPNLKLENSENIPLTTLDKKTN